MTHLLWSVVALTIAITPSQAADLAELSGIFNGHYACFVVHDVSRNKTIRWNPDRCSQRFTPCSTFKIPNALIALETGVAK